MFSLFRPLFKRNPVRDHLSLHCSFLFLWPIASGTKTAAITLSVSAVQPFIYGVSANSRILFLFVARLNQRLNPIAVKLIEVTKYSPSLCSFFHAASS